jgi:hypothetical protein
MLIDCIDIISYKKAFKCTLFFFKSNIIFHYFISDFSTTTNEGTPETKEAGPIRTIEETKVAEEVRVDVMEETPKPNVSTIQTLQKQGKIKFF